LNYFSIRIIQITQIIRLIRIVQIIGIIRIIVLPELFGYLNFKAELRRRSSILDVCWISHPEFGFYNLIWKPCTDEHTQHQTRRNESAPEQFRWRDKEKTETRQRHRQSRWHTGRRNAVSLDAFALIRRPLLDRSDP